jgi:dolichyl-phosphate-mannose-protein mannosyltransferase
MARTQHRRRGSGGAVTAPLRRPARSAERLAPHQPPATALPPLGWRRLDTLLLTLVVVAGLALYLIRLGAPYDYSFDEVYHAFTAAQFVSGNADAWVWYTTVPPDSPKNTAYEWTHPPGAKLFMEAGIHLLGNAPPGWRLTGAFFGAAGLGLMYALGRLLFGRLAGVFAATLLALDGLWFVMARTAMNDVYVTTFLLLTYLFLFFYLRGPAGRHRYIWLVGLGLGLAAACKWSASYSFAIVGIMVGLREAHAALVGRKDCLRWVGGAAGFFALWTIFFLTQGLTLTWSGVWAGLITIGGLAGLEAVAALRGRGRWPGPATTWMGAFFVVPLAIYVASYFQFFTMGHTPAQLIELQQQMYWYHTHLKATHPWASRWWTWPLVIKPVWFYTGTAANGLVTNVYAMGNPFIWWAFVPAALYGLWRWYRSGAPLSALRRLQARAGSVFAIYDWVTSRRGVIGLTLALLGFFGQWLPWALSPRISFMYHMLPSVPFGCLLIAYALVRLRSPRLAVLGYILPVVAVFIFFYPIYSALPISPTFLNQHFWMESWRPH